MPAIIEFSRCISTYSSAKLEKVTKTNIKELCRENVLERLYTMEDSCNRKIQRNGLGLTIARKLARQMGGDILLESEPSIRTVFTVKLRSSIY